MSNKVHIQVCTQVYSAHRCTERPKHMHVSFCNHTRSAVFPSFLTGERGDGAPSSRPIGWQDVSAHPGLPGSELVSLHSDDTLPLTTSECVLMCLLHIFFVSSSNVDTQTCSGNTALHYSCLHNKSDCVRLLLRARASTQISEADTHTVTPDVLIR